MFRKREVLDFTHAELLRREMTSWDFFVIRHRQPANLVVHFFCCLLYFGGWALVLATWNPWYLLGPVLSSVIGSPSHYLFDDGVVGFREGEGILTRYVPLYVASIYWRMLRGRYRGDIERAEARYREIMDALARGELEAVADRAA